MISNFNGNRLKAARLYRGYSLAELAQRSDCSRQSLSMYESGKTKPLEAVIVMKIAEALNFPSKFFMEKDLPISSNVTYFRSLLTTKQSYRFEQIQRMDLVAAIYNFLKDYVEFPKVDIPDCSLKTPEEAAKYLRKYWNLGNGPIQNLIDVVEQHGIIVTCFPTKTDTIDAFSQKVDINIDEHAFLIGYSNNKNSAARIHFDIAHELGHICMHDWTESIEKLDRVEFKEREKEANMFASAFLLPENTFKAQFYTDKVNIPFLTLLKSQWKVSIQAIVKRAYDLGLISIEKYQSLMIILQKRGLRKNEPLDDKLITAPPSLLKIAVEMLLNDDVFTKEEFMEELSLNYDLSLAPGEVEELLDLPENTLKDDEDHFFSHTIKLKIVQTT